MDSLQAYLCLGDFILDQSFNQKFKLALEYKKGKDLRSDPTAQLVQFEKVLQLEDDQKTKLGFKSHKQIIKIHDALNNSEMMISHYKQLFSYMKKSVVSGNYFEKTIYDIIDKNIENNRTEILKELLEITIEALKDMKRVRFSFSITYKLACWYLERKNLAEFEKVLKNLKQLNDMSSDKWKEQQSCQLYALEIQSYVQEKYFEKAKEKYEQFLKLQTAFDDAMVCGTIHECGGMMYMNFKDFKKAYFAFFNAYKKFLSQVYDRFVVCLQKMFLVKMHLKKEELSFSEFQTKFFWELPEVKALSDLINAYQQHNLDDFLSILNLNKEDLMSDEFVGEYIGDLLEKIRSWHLYKLVYPYKRIKISYIAKVLQMDVKGAEDLVVRNIMDITLAGHIDLDDGMFVSHTVRRPGTPQPYVPL